MTAKIALGFQIRVEECVKSTSALYAQITLTRRAIAFLESITLKEEERQMPTDLSCWSSSCERSHNCRQHLCLSLPLPSLHHLASPFSFFSLLLKMLRLYSLQLWPAGKQNEEFFSSLTYS